MSKLLEIFGKAITADTADLIWHWLDAVRTKNSNQSGLAELEPVLDMMAKMELDGACEKLKFYLFEQPGCTAGRILAAAICLHKNDVAGALESLQSVYLREPNNTMALYAMGHCYERLGCEAEAVEFYQDCLKFKNYLQLPRQRLGAIYFKNGQIEKTIAEYQELKNEYPDDIASLGILGYLYIANMDYELAIDAFNTAILIHPDNFHANSIDFETAELIKAGENYEAVSRLGGLIEEQPEVADLYVQLADILVQIGDAPEAILNYEKAIRIQPSYLEATVKLGSLYLGMGQNALAAEEFNKAVEINDEIVDAYVGLATAQKLAEQNDQACGTLSLAAAIEQNSAILFTKTATLHFQTAIADYGRDVVDIEQRNKLIEAVMQAHQKQLKIHPNNIDLHYKYGLLLMNIEQMRAAQDAFKRVIDINPTHYRAMVKLALCLFECGEQAEALKHLTAIETESKETLKLHYETAILYCDKNRFRTAMENMRDSLAGDFDLSETNVSISTVLQNLGLLDRAAATWDSLRQVTQSALTD